ncbi:hypothetical protein Tco_1118781 [Tanacetum coccineum]
MNYPADGGDDDDDDDLSGDDAHDEDKDEEEEEEHLAPTDSTSAATPPPPPAYRTTTRMPVRSQAPISFPSEAEVARLFIIPTPQPSPLTLLSSPLPQIPSPPTHTSPTYAEAPLGYKAVGIWLRAASQQPSPTSPPTHHPLPLPPPSSPLLLPSTDCKADIFEVVLPPQKRLCLAPGLRFKVEESSSATARPTRDYRSDYGFIGTLDAKLRCDRVREMGYEITGYRGGTTDYCGRVEPAGDGSCHHCQVNMLRRDRQYHLHTTMLVESEARVAQEVWEQSMGYSRAIHDELQGYRTHTQIQDTHISSLEALVTTLVSQTTSLQTQLIAALGRIDILEARETAHTDDPKDADSCS